MPSPFLGMDPYLEGSEWTSFHFEFAVEIMKNVQSAMFGPLPYNSLPIVPIPLLPEDKDVTLDLQLALNTIYDSVGYDLVLNYTKPPDIPLDENAVQWAATLLKN